MLETSAYARHFCLFKVVVTRAESARAIEAERDEQNRSVTYHQMAADPARYFIRSQETDRK
jgi:hypothetical protein